MAESEASAYGETMEEGIAENAIKNEIVPGKCKRPKADTPQAVAKESERTRVINQPPN